MCAEGQFCIQHFIPDSSITNIYINFPEPWRDSKKESKKRIIQLQLLILLAKKVKRGGNLFIVTDDERLRDWTRSIMWEIRELWKSEIPLPIGYSTQELEEYKVKKVLQGGFENALREKGKNVYYQKYKRL